MDKRLSGKETPAPRNDDIEKLSVAINLMAQRLDNSHIREQRLIEDLSRHSRQLKEMNAYLVDFEESERKSIASELNGILTRNLGIGLSKIRRLVNEGNYIHQNDLWELQIFLEHAVRDIGTVMHELAPPVLNDFSVEIDAALGGVIRELNEAHGIDISFNNSVDEGIGISQPMRITLYRATKTILTDILKQSPTPSAKPQAKVDLSVDHSQLNIRIHAYGQGLDTEKILSLPANRSGAHLLSERIAQLGGAMTAPQTPDNCIIIHLSAPLSQ
ncbi:MAG: hypothetical protein MI802_24475 [Desulfobacterales bacterium]|nr:hypothetical protein [Desulfobacterales bacterium]